MESSGGADCDVAQSLVGRVTDGIVAFDADGRCTYLNRQAATLLGDEKTALLGVSADAVFSSVIDSQLRDRVTTAIAGDTPRTINWYSSDLGQQFELQIYPDDSGATVLLRRGEPDTTRRRLNQIFETIPVGVVILDAEGRITQANRRAEELLGLERHVFEERRFDHPEWDIWHDDGTPIEPEDHPVTYVQQTGQAVRGFTHGITLPDGTERWLSSNVAPVFDASGSIDRIVVGLEDVTVLKRLDRLIETFHPIHEVLNEAPERQAIEKQICDLLIASNMYELAWIGEYVPGTSTLETHVTAGPKTGYIDDIQESLVEMGTTVTPAQTAIETREIQVVDSTQDDPRFEPWRANALEHDLYSAAAIPLVHKDRAYGVLGLYTARTDAFDEREQALLEALGERIGQVFHALETEKLLYADEVVELTFRSTDRASLLIDVSATLECDIEVQSSIPVSGESLLYYVSVEGASVDAVAELLREADESIDPRVIRRFEDADGGVLELQMGQCSLAYRLVQLGAVVTMDHVHDGEATVVCELPADADVSAFVTRLTEEFPATELAAKREYSRDSDDTRDPPTEPLPDLVASELTDRQRQVLQAAFHGGYFESPRRSSATDIADALSLTQSTVSYHLRNAQKTLFEHLLEQ